MNADGWLWPGVGSHTLDRLRVDFDAPNLIANAGLLLPAMLGERLGLPELLRQHVDLGRVPGAANPDVKAFLAFSGLETIARPPSRSPRTKPQRTRDQCRTGRGPMARRADAA